MKIKKALLYANVIYLLLNLAFFVILLVFVVQSGSGKLVYEKVYAKEIALMLDEAKPSMTIFLDVSDALKIAEKNNVKKEEAIKIDSVERKVRVKLGSGKGYSYGYFTSLKIEQELKKDNEKDIFVIKISGEESEK